ncbi:MAG: glycosyltransferase family 4 protein [Gallionella sp.]|jgi:glycosyltransferase involved in cell wall biosynthesis
MKIVILSETFSKNMGYMVAMLPKYLARLGADVHVVTTDLSPYYQTQDFAKTYTEFSSKSQLALGSVELHDGYTLHALPHHRVFGHLRIKGLRKKLAEIQPDITYSLPAIGWIPLEATLLKMLFGYKLFTGNHTTASVFPLARRTKTQFDLAYVKNFLTRVIPGRFTSIFTEKCYGATKDCADIAVRFFGVEKSKIDVCPLGVDTDLFHPLKTEEDFIERANFRNELGVGDDKIVCVYTGRFSDDKNPRVLGEAIARLVAQGEPYRAIFVGHGVQAEALKQLQGCTVFPFTPVENLPQYYRSADIGVWPTQESTSMLDAAACGLPLIVNDTIIATERIEGNGLTYHLNDVDDMVRVLLLLKDPSLRKKLGDAGAHKMAMEFNWDSIARRRLNDFKAALSNSQ